MNTTLTLGERIKRVRSSTTQTGFSDEFGISQNTLSRYERNERLPDADFIKHVCKRHGISPKWLLFGEGQMYECKTTESQRMGNVSIRHDTEDFVLIPKVSGKLTTHLQTLVMEKDILGYYAFQKNWIHDNGKVESMVLMDVTGESMNPEMKHGDIILIDQSQRTIIPYGYYAINIHAAVYIKQIQHTPERLILHSTNPLFDDIHVEHADKKQEQITVIGRVIWLGRKLT